MLPGIIAVFIVVGLVMYFVNTFLPMEPNIKKMMNIVVIIVLALYCLQYFGILGPLDTVNLRR